MDLSDFCRRHLDHGIALVVTDDLSKDTCGASCLCARVWLELEVVEECAYRDFLERKRVAWLKWSVYASDNRLAWLYALWKEDVAALAVAIGDETDEA